MRILCYRIVIGGMPISIYQNGIENFTVQYWKQVKKRLCYHDAALELGSCIMHALACESKLDNRDKGEH